MNFDNNITDSNQPLLLHLLPHEGEILLRALEIYIYNLEYMLNDNKCTDTERQNKLSIAKFTYEEVLMARAEYLNGKIEHKPTEKKSKGVVVNLNKKIMEDKNIIKIIPETGKFEIINK